MPVERRRRKHAPRPARAPAVAIAANQRDQAAQGLSPQTPNQEHDQEHVHAPRGPPEPLDVVWGAEAIAKTIRRPTRAVYHLLQKDLLPARKVGANWVASRAALLRYFSGDAA